MLAAAPVFPEILDEIRSRLRERIVVGHVVDFDLRFLRAEFALAGEPLPPVEGAALCTRELASRVGIAVPRTLARCCELAGITLRGAHSALGDARATAALLAWFLSAGAEADLARLAAVAAALAWHVPVAPGASLSGG
jgi:DNA polymerase-3 subunit epsilon